MKRSVTIFIALSVILALTGCEPPIASDTTLTDAVSDTADKSDNVSGSDISVPSVTAAKNEDDPMGQVDSKYQLIGAYLNDENEVCADFSSLPKSEDYDLFRKYFFGAWESSDGYLPQSLTIDDSEKINFAGRGYFGEFYQPSNHVIAFTLRTNGDANVVWLDTADPDVMYTAVFMMKNGTGVFTLDGSISKVHTLTKSDALPNEPGDGFLSIFKLHEMSHDHSIDFDLLTYIDYGMVDGEYLLHSATYDFYPMYLVSEAEDKIVIRTSVGNVGDNDIKPVDVICTFEKAEGEWNRRVELGDEPSALSLLNCRVNEDGFYCIDETAWNFSDDYKLFRKYFFGTWEGSFRFPEAPEQKRLIIDDTENSFFMTETDIKILNGFYETGAHALAFLTGSAWGPAIIWIDLDEPDTIYMVWGGIGSNHCLWSEGESELVSPALVVYTLKKTNEPLNEPEEDFLSIFKLYEMAKEYGIDPELLVKIKYEIDGTILYHDDWGDLYPMYLVSKSDNEIVIRTSVGNVLETEKEPVEVLCTFERIDGEWSRRVELF